MTYRIKMWMGLIMFAFLVFLFIRIPVWNFLTGRASTQDAIAGEWVGMMQISGDNVNSVLGPTPGPHRKAAVRFSLRQSDGSMDRYAGSGEMFILGEAHARPVQIGDFHQGPNEYITIRTLQTPALPDKFNGTLNDDVMTWKNDSEGYGFTAKLHKGTDADYQRLLQDKP
jgi:hypothetical protein